MLKEFEKTYEIFKESGVCDPLRESLRLFDILSGGSLSAIDASLLRKHDIDPSSVARLRKDGVPLEHILGRALFGRLKLHCSKETLIPTDWTQLLVQVSRDLIVERQKTERDQMRRMLDGRLDR